MHANDALPTGPRTLSARTVFEGQQEIEIELYEQSGARPGPEMEENKFLNEGKGSITGLPPLPKASPLEIEMKVDEEGLLEVNATEPSTGKSLRIEVRVSVLSEEEVREATSTVSALTVSS
ncbi:Hsp70 family protein [Amycolatopsis coloradensis]|uniref:Hsp70 family protein n=1 Tax=Amycolatopsis coloradensis TaxID=76021 RepID=UPI003CC56A2F